MARKKTGDKLADIRRAAIVETAQVGSAAVSVNAIAKRAGLAVGTLYRYHATKDDLLRAAYLEIKTEIHAALLTAAHGCDTSRERIRAMWFAVLNYARAHPQNFMFAEVIMNAALLTETEQMRVAEMAADISGIIAAGIADGALRPGRIEAISAFLVAPAMQLGRKTALANEAPDTDYAEEIFSLCWRAVAA